MIILYRVMLLLKQTELYQRGLNVMMEFSSSLLRWTSYPSMLKDRHTMGVLLLVSGNHVHKALQVLTFIICKSCLVFLIIQSENIETMCKSVILTAASMSDTAIQRKAQEIHDKFVDVFVLFSHCHKIYES